MSDDFEQQDWVKFGVASALFKQYSADERAFLQQLATMLEAALPQDVDIERRGGLFSKKTVHRVTLTLAENRYSLEDTGHGPLQAARTHVVRGIALKTEPLPVQDWLAEIGALLDERARASAQAREALSRLVG